MATFTKLNGFVEHLAEKVHNLGSDQLVVALSNVAPGSESIDPNSSTANCVLANITEVAYTYCSNRNLTVSSSAQASGTYRLILNDLTLTASGGSVGPFRYIYIYNSTPSFGPADPLIGYYDYGASITLNDTETLTLDFDAVNGVLSLS